METDKQKALIPLSEIAKELGQEPKKLARLAREGIISAEKKGNRWYANKDQVKKDLRKRTWSLTKLEFRFQINEIFDILSNLVQFIIVYGIIYILINWVNQTVGSFRIVIDSSPFSAPLILTILIFILRSFSKATRSVEQAGQFWRNMSTFQSRVFDLKERVETLEHKCEMQDKSSKVMSDRNVKDREDV